MQSLSSEDAVRAVLTDEVLLQQKSKEFSNEIGQNRMDISALVDALSFALTSTEIELRAKGTKLFSATLSALPADLLAAAQISFIVQFYCDRTKDHHSVVPFILDGILSVTQMKHIPAGSVAQIMQALFKNVSCQSQVRDDRQKIFNLLRSITENHADELRAMGTDFVYGVINAIDGERDPRILFSIFDFLPHFLRTIPLGHLAEEMFEVCGCYFPVDFHPSPDDPLSITRDKLAEKLALCMAGHPEFADECIPLALEKLGSQLTIAKLDSLNLLILAAQNFPSEKIESLFNDIWTAVHVEIRMKDDKPTEISALALTTLYTIVQSTAHNEPLCGNVLKVILDSVISSVTDPDSKFFATSSTIALTAAAASKYSATNVANKVLPLLIFQTELYRDNAQRLSQIRELIANVVEVCVEKKVVQSIDASTLTSIRTEYLSGLSADEDPDARHVTLVCLTKSVEILTEHNRLQIYSTVNELINESSERNVDQLKHLLVALAKDNPNEFKATFLDNWLQGDVVNASNAKHTIQTIGSLVEIPQFTDIAIQFLFKHIFDTPVSEFRDLALKNVEALLATQLKPFVFQALYRKFAILRRFVDLVRSQSATCTSFLSTVSNCIRCVVKNLSIDEQSSIVTDSVMSTMDLSSVGDLYLTAAIVGSVSEQVDIDVVHFGLDVVRILIRAEDKDAVQIGCHLLCSVFNKATVNERNDEAISRTIAEIEERVQSGDAQAVQVFAWVAKGLLVRGDRRTDAIVQKLLDLLVQPDLSDVAADAFDVISLELPSIHLPIIRHLYKQKLFHIVSTRLLKVSGSPTDSLSEAQLRAFAYILRMVPYQVLNLNLDKVGPILFKCLGHDHPILIEIAIAKIDGYLAQQHDYFQTRLNHLVHSYLKLTTYKASMHIRIAALNAIQTIAKYPAFVVAPFKADVVFALLAPLDDAKRMVRNAAVAARNQWFLVGVADAKK